MKYLLYQHNRQLCRLLHQSINSFRYQIGFYVLISPDKMPFPVALHLVVAWGTSLTCQRAGVPHSFPRAGQGSAIPVISGAGAGVELGGVQQWVLLHGLHSY